MYAYDNAGNITSKREYAYTTGTLGSVLSTITYTYGDSAWGDLLTAYNGNAISYDTIGNPLSDGTWTYTWEHGRELASMYAEDTDGTDNEVTVSYTYNADGLRIRKTVTTKTYEAVQHTVTFVADGTTVKTMTVNDGYTLTASDYPAVPPKSGYTGSWNQYTSPVTSDVTIQAVYTANPTYTVTFVADGVTVKTMTVNDGYTLTASDYPAVPPKSGYTGSWPEHSSPITANTTITAVYTANPTYTVTFVADGVTVKTMTVNDGYTLTASDYPAVPAKNGYTGSWPEHSSPITANTTITAVYTPIPTEPSEPPAATHTVTFRVTYSASYGYTVKTMTVEDGYVLTAADYPTTYGITWQQYTSPITSDVTVNGTYSWGGYGAAEEAEATGEIPAEVAAESTAVSRTGSTTLVKTVTETYDYVYNGDRLSQVKKTTSTTTSSGTTNATDTLNFTYDANGTPMAVKYNNTNYYYVTNLQGDVTAILNTSGTAVASYTYDAWGNILTTTGSMASTLGTLNPLRYRGYVYDTETELYYVSSRYYNPGIGRWINADGAYDTNQGVLGYNMYAYCLNNPVNMYDPDGGCSKFLGFLWKIDCKQASCPTSKNYIMPKSFDPIGSYNKGQGYVYVVMEDQLSEIMENKENNVVVIVDKRTSSDPNMQIQESYKITKTKQQKEIAQLMIDYNASNPVDPAWSRTLESLVKEWQIHNFAYDLGYKRDRTGDCDFNNADEGKGFWDFIGR